MRGNALKELYHWLNDNPPEEYPILVIAVAILIAVLSAGAVILLSAVL